MAWAQCGAIRTASSRSVGSGGKTTIRIISATFLLSHLTTAANGADPGDRPGISPAYPTKLRVCDIAVGLKRWPCEALTRAQPLRRLDSNMGRTSRFSCTRFSTHALHSLNAARMRSSPRHHGSMRHTTSSRTTTRTLALDGSRPERSHRAIVTRTSTSMDIESRCTTAARAIPQAKTLKNRMSGPVRPSRRICGENIVGAACIGGVARARISCHPGRAGAGIRPRACSSRMAGSAPKHGPSRRPLLPPSYPHQRADASDAVRLGGVRPRKNESLQGGRHMPPGVDR